MEVKIKPKIRVECQNNIEHDLWEDEMVGLVLPIIDLNPLLSLIDNNDNYKVFNQLEDDHNEEEEKEKTS